MILVIAFHLKTRQLNFVNAFLNAHNNELVYCQMSDEYRLSDKIYRVIRTLYDQRKSSLLWLRILIIKCLELRLKLISEKSCLFISDKIIMFFYVNDIVFVYCTNRKRVAETYIDRLKSIFEMRDMRQMKFFLEIRIIQDQNAETIHLVQDIYIDKLVKNYKININSKASSISLSVRFVTESYDEDVDSSRMHKYCKKIESVCYSVVISRSNIVKTTSKLAEHLINSRFDHLTAVNHLIRYLYETKHLIIRFDVSKDEKVFEVIADAAFANEKERKSVEEYTFKLFDDLIDWATKKQTTMSTSITEIELLIMLNVDKKFIWWLNLFKKIEFSSDHQMTLYNDNLQTIRLLISEIAKVDTKLRHIDVTQCWLRKSVQRDILKMNYLLTAKMTADDMTKMLSSQKHKEFMRQLELVNIKKMMNNEINWESRLREDRVDTIIKEIRCAKNRFFECSISRCSRISIMQASQHLKRISTSFYGAVSGLFSHLNVINRRLNRRVNRRWEIRLISVQLYSKLRECVKALIQHHVIDEYGSSYPFKNGATHCILSLAYLIDVCY
jgi:hypothetical protein